MRKTLIILAICSIFVFSTFAGAINIDKNQKEKMKNLSDCPLDLWTKKSEYKKGTPIFLKVTNIGDEPVEFTLSIRIEINGEYHGTYTFLSLFDLEPEETLTLPPVLSAFETGTMELIGEFLIDGESYYDSTTFQVIKSRSMHYNLFLQKIYNKFPILNSLIN